MGVSGPAGLWPACSQLQTRLSNRSLVCHRVPEALSCPFPGLCPGEAFPGMLPLTSLSSCPAMVYSTELIPFQPVLFIMFILLIICLFHAAENSLGDRFLSVYVSIPSFSTRLGIHLAYMDD